MKRPRIAFHTLGCKLNAAETDTLMRQGRRRGYAVTHSPEGADIYVINSCSVTEEADRKTRKLIRRFLRTNPHGKVAVIGCYAQLQPRRIAQIPGVEWVVGTREKFRLYELLEQGGGVFQSPIREARTVEPAYSLGEERTRAYLKIQEGCDYVCAFCTIPRARGRSRSADPEAIVAAARRIAESGIREIVITGVNIGTYRGPGGESFLDLLRRLDAVPGIERYRISSIEPNLLTDDILQFTADSPRFMPHFHIPLQSGSDEILRAMRRKYDAALYVDRVEAVLRYHPEAAVGVDVIVGFPGEADRLFERTYRFLEALPVAYLHVFPYSRRPHTAAAKMPGQVPADEKRRRVHALRLLSEQKRQEFARRWLGTARPVLVEHTPHAGGYEGYTDNYVRVRLPHGAHLSVGQVINVYLEKVDDSGKVIARAAQPV